MLVLQTHALICARISFLESVPTNSVVYSYLHLFETEMHALCKQASYEKWLHNCESIDLQ